MVTAAGQPEIFRAVQRDDAFQKQLQDSTSDIVLNLLGIQTWVRWREYIRIASKLIYFTSTTMRNLQTLGEEYTGIVHLTDENKLPTREVRALMILLDCFGEKFVDFLLLRAEKILAENEDLREEAKFILLSLVTRLRLTLPAILRLHKSIFYIQGNYYHMSKRATGIRYALVRFWLRDRTVVSKFRLLGLLSFFNQIASSILHLRKSLPEVQGREINDGDGGLVKEKCSLCLNQRLNTSVTPCGHLYCWNCILPWLAEQPFCPLCRQNVLPSRVVLLRNL